jgi:hypothetical protein
MESIGVFVLFSKVCDKESWRESPSLEMLKTPALATQVLILSISKRLVKSFSKGIFCYY